MTAATDRPVLAIDIGGTKIAAGIVRGTAVTHRAQLATPRSGKGTDIVAAIAALRRDLPPAEAIGVATTGIVNSGALTALNPTTLPIENGFPLTDALAAELGDRPVVLNDAQAAAWAEYRAGAGRGINAMAFVTVSTGIGGGFVVAGRLQTGGSGLAGHIGHVVVDPDGPACGCGRRGCVERIASGTGIAALASAAFGRPLDAAAVFALAAGGDATADRFVDRAALLLARVLTDAVALLDLDCIVVGGGVGLAPGFLDRIRGHATREPETFHRPLLQAELGPDAGLVGAALLADGEKFHRQ